MGKKVKVVTKCGEIHHYEYNQDVETVEIVEEKKVTTFTLEELRLALNNAVDKGINLRIYDYHIDEEGSFINEEDEVDWPQNCFTGHIREIRE